MAPKKKTKKLKVPKAAVELDRMKIVNYVIEDNVPRGTQWVVLYIVLGYLSEESDEDSFVEYVDPNTGLAAVEAKIEDGNNPLAPGQALGKCDTCDKWFQAISGTCDEGGCSGTILPYDGCTRLLDAVTENNDTWIEACRKEAYDFLLSEEIPDPNDWPTLRLIVEIEDL